MASKVKVAVSLDETLVKELDGINRERRTHRSGLVEEALRVRRRRLIDQQLKEGYQSMAASDCAPAIGRWEV